LEILGGEAGLENLPTGGVLLYLEGGMSENLGYFIASVLSGEQKIVVICEHCDKSILINKLKCPYCDMETTPDNNNMCGVCEREIINITCYHCGKETPFIRHKTRADKGMDELLKNSEEFANWAKEFRKKAEKYRDAQRKKRR
jgi:hypothetical protein